MFNFMLSIIFGIDFIFIAIILIFSLYFDLKFRRISNKHLKIFYLISLILNFLEFWIFYKIFLLFIILKFLIFILTFLISLLLFSLKIIGGGDGKLIILIFLTHPIKYLEFGLILLFFLLFSLLFFIFFFSNFLINHIMKNSYSFEILFSYNIKISVFKRFYLKMFFRFFNLSEIIAYQGYKKSIKSQTIFYNSIKKKLQLFAQYKPPLVLMCILSYYTIFFLKIGF